ncbi:MAG: RidA family protein [Candidatus Melainabacteria bacterium]|nr:MAG: RidA family protein [Candidatus Melainabacteria bacterium]
MNRQQLAQKGILLNAPKRAVGLYAGTRIVEGLFSSRLLVSGHGPWSDPATAIKGKLGKDLSIIQGQDAARLVGIGILSTIDHEVGIERLIGIVKALGMVNSTPDFADQPAVIDGFSQLMLEVFGPENGIGTRSAVSMASLPFGIAVEIEAEFIIKPLWLWKIQNFFGWDS